MRAAKKSPTDAVLNLALKDKLSKLSTDGKTCLFQKNYLNAKKKRKYIWKADRSKNKNNFSSK